MPFADRREVTDQMGRKVLVPREPQRIISLVPSQTELLVDLGLEDRLVGVTKFCVHPREVRLQKTIVGGTKNLNLNVIRSLNPDLVIGNKEENVQAQIEELFGHFPVWMSDVNDIADAEDMIAKLGEITGTSVQARNVLSEVRQSLALCRNCGNGKPAIYFIWNDPMMVVGANTFIDAMVKHAGWRNMMGHVTRYPELTDRLYAELPEKPDILFLSTEPFPFSEKHRLEIEERFGCRAVLVDGEMFSWYGSRLALAGTYLRSLADAVKQRLVTSGRP
jgi:ABC-type Fe3+-hydroxamate transport system substrate-binding protein